jgi:mannan endo-1,4-beta-mannosidase
MRRTGIVIAMLVPAALLAVASHALIAGNTVPVIGIAIHQPVVPTAAPAGTRCGPRKPPAGLLVGLAPGARMQRKVASFTAGSGIRPNVVEYYREFGKPFDPNFACVITRAGALPLIQLLPRLVSIPEIASGQYDRYLRSYARAVKRFGHPVALSFAHEMNGNWELWGWQHTTPADFRAAWRRIHDVFAAVGATNVIWVWNVNRQSSDVSGAREWWPGAAYVNWVGVDAYYRSRAATFATVFNGTIHSLRTFTSDPILVCETGAGRTSRQGAQILSLFAGITRTRGVLGFVWFDVNAKERWRIDNRPAALAAFRNAAAIYG